MIGLVLPQAAPLLRAAMIAGAALGLTACASEPVRGPAGFIPMMMLSAQPASAAVAPMAMEPADPLHELSRKSLAAKVLASRALESVTGLPIDPARLSEHD